MRFEVIAAWLSDDDCISQRTYSSCVSSLSDDDCFSQRTYSSCVSSLLTDVTC